MADSKQIPAWAEELRRRYLRGESSIFVLHGNVFDDVVEKDRMVPLADFLTAFLAESKDTVAIFNLATGIRYTKRPKDPVSGLEEILNPPGRDKQLAALERILTTGKKVAVIIEYAEAIAPGGDPSFQADADRASIITLHRWSFLPGIEKGDNVVLLIAENLSELSPKIVSNPKVAVVDIPMPDRETRRRATQLSDPTLTAKDAERFAEVTAGLKVSQISSILSPPPQSEADSFDREAFITGLLGGSEDAAARAHKLAILTANLSREEIKNLIAPTVKELAPAPAETPADRARREADILISKRKREILERECFGLVEFITPEHGFDVVGGMEEIKKDLLVVAENIREARRSRVPMGILFTGPMGTGKTFVAEAFAKECGLPTIKLKNFRSKWVGATEGNLEKILSVIKAIGQVIVIIDEGDRAFGNTDGEGDGGTSSRVIARIKEFMSDTSNRGRILFVAMTNRPDKLDVDLKRAGRLDRKIPFLYSQTAEEVEGVARALVKKNRIKTDVDFTAIREGFSTRLIGYSNADVEAVILMANDDAARETGGEAPVLPEHFVKAAHDYFPSRDVELLEYMELLAVFEASSRRLLPPKYAGMSPEELDTRLRLLRATVGSRR
ncbi:MAG: AAA family ATPase [Thermoanaerobaculia bacterium]|nr:ATP-dependent zinc metalloprotease FtsH [Thermoanaerobaculia bacterium]MCK6685696.1 AAA family ATPase [Thermoanaerobaculia bacterium]